MPRVELFTPIHKGIRSMNYKLGTELQIADFADEDATKAIVAKLEHNMSVATSTCILCLLHEHACIEDDHIFAKVSGFESGPYKVVFHMA